ncbi:hypothetical protein LUZ60_017008 [Juncus effusus]|nr:hypothetical protein LUZ60_017008 [Juncus effusus]
MRGGVGAITPPQEMGGGGGGRVPQWGQQETRELISIRGEMERAETGKRGNASNNNKTMWEQVAARMRERGFSRTADQCKCKWKNLVNRYKGKETTDPENTRQCPFFDELHAVFTERAKTMHRKLLESETPLKNKPKRNRDDDASDDVDEDAFDDVSDEDTKPAQNKRTKQKPGSTTASTSGRGMGIQELIEGFMKQQEYMEREWRERAERRGRERMEFEQGWRENMERLERERLTMERAWMEREEQRRVREESRAQRRDQLLTTLLNKLLHDEL